MLFTLISKSLSHRKKAVQLLGEMRGEGVAPNAHTFTAAIGACPKEVALALLGEMLAQGVLEGTTGVPRNGGRQQQLV